MEDRLKNFKKSMEQSVFKQVSYDKEKSINKVLNGAKLSDDNMDKKAFFPFKRNLAGILGVVVCLGLLFFTYQISVIKKSVTPDKSANPSLKASSRQNGSSAQHNQDAKNTTKQPTQTNTTNKQILSMDFISENQGWMTTLDKNNKVHLYQTSNGGEAWKEIHTSKNFGRTWIHFFNNHEGYIDGANNNMLFTKDGGKTWTLRPLPGHEDNASMIQFVSKKSIWELGNIGGAAGSENATLYHSLDGGIHWTKAAKTSQKNKGNSLQYYGDKIGISFINDKTGWVTGSYNMPGFYAELTQDGGKSWVNQTFPSLPLNKIKRDGAGIQVNPPRFTNKTDGWLTIVSPNTQGYLLQTKDSGKGWKLIKNFGHLISHLVTTDSNHVWVVEETSQNNQGESNTIKMTTDGGEHWHSASIPEIKNIKQLKMVNNQVGWLLSGNPVNFSSKQNHLYKTIDGGHTWKKIY